MSKTEITTDRAWIEFGAVKGSHRTRAPRGSFGGLRGR